MSQSPFLSAAETVEAWEAQKNALLREQNQDLEQAHPHVARFDANGQARKASEFGMENMLNTTPMKAALAYSAIGVGAVMSSPVVGVIGMIALGKVAYDVLNKRIYNETIKHHNQVRDAIQSAGSAQEAAENVRNLGIESAGAPKNWAQKLEDGMTGKSRIMGMAAAGSLAGIVIGGVAPIVGAGLCIVGASVVATTIGLGMAGKGEGLGQVAGRAYERTLDFASRLGARRDAAEPEVLIEPRRPSGP